MLFRKKRPMIDVAELQRKGMVPKNPRSSPPQSVSANGFLDLHAKKHEEGEKSDSSSAVDFFGFNNFSPEKTTETSASTNNTFSTEQNGYSKREVDEKITDLDNKIYKLEQRLELLERKAGVTDTPSQNSVGPMGW